MRPEIKEEALRLLSSNVKLLLPIPIPIPATEDQDSNVDRDLFEKAVMVAFDMHDENVMDDFTNLDLLWDPPLPKNKVVNYFQLMNEEAVEREPIFSTFSFLFTNSDPYYNDKYLRTKGGKEGLLQYWKHLRETFESPKEFVEFVEFMLFLTPGTLSDYEDDAARAWKPTSNKPKENSDAK